MVMRGHDRLPVNDMFTTDDMFISRTTGEVGTVNTVSQSVTDDGHATDGEDGGEGHNLMQSELLHNVDFLFVAMGTTNRPSVCAGHGSVARVARLGSLRLDHSLDLAGGLAQLPN
jgi:hypothetical protein